MFSKANYEAVADTLRTADLSEAARKRVVEDFAVMFEEDNERFSPQMFLRRCDPATWDRRETRRRRHSSN